MPIDFPASPLTALTLPELRRRRSEKWVQYPADVLPLWVAEMDTPLADPIQAALREAVVLGDTGYARAGGLPQAYAEFAVERFDWQTEPAAMRLVPDVMQGVVAVLDVVSPPGCEVVVNPPVYPPFFSFLSRSGRQVRQSPLHFDGARWSLDIDRLADDFARPQVAAYLLCNPQNPTGTVYRRDELLAVAELAERHNVRVLVDEIHAPLVHPGSTHVPFTSLASQSPAAARAVVLVSASKAWNLAGLKAALAIPGPLAHRDLALLPEDITDGAGIFGIIASEAALRHGRPWLDQLLLGLDFNRHLLATLLRAQLPAVRYQPPEATYLAWLDCRQLDLPDEPSQVFLHRGRVAVNPGPSFGATSEGFVRLNLATHPDILVEAVNRMAAAT